MVRRFRRLTLGIAALVALTAIILALGVARSEAASAGEEASPPPTVVRELVEERTATCEVYLLSDGTKRTCLFEVPVHYRDADGTWQAIDRRLVPTGAPGVFASAATEAEVVVAGEGKGRLPVTISFDGASVGFDLLGAVEDQPLVLGDEKAHFLAVDTATDLTYAVTDRGVKETITLASKEAPDRFTFFLAHEDLTLKRDETGQWGFYRKGEKQPLFELSDLLVYDSSESAAGVADVCDEAAMTVTPAPGGSYLTYAVPRKWLEDESRVWPVMIDPSITLGQAVCIDTFVCSANPTSTYGSSTDLRAGRYDATTGWNRSLIKFAVSSIDDPGVPYIHDANLRVRQYSGGSSPQTHVGVMEESWSNATTWNGLNDDGGVDFHNIGNPSVSANEWLEQGCKTYVQNWLDGDSTYPNYGFTIYQNSGEGANYYRKFRSSDYGTSTYRPRIEVEYDDDHYAGVSDYPASATIGETGSAVSVTMKTYTDYPGDVLKMELGLNLAAGVSSRYRGWLCWFRDDPGAGWTKQQLADGSYVAYQAGQLGNDRISVSFASCSAATTSTYRRVTFAFTLNENYGDVQDTDFDTKFAMGPGTNVTWSSGDWVSHDVNFDARPKPVTSAEKDAEGSELFFCGLGANDTVGSGRGWAKLVWNPVAGANGYHVYLLDGNAYRKVGTQTALEGDGKYHWSTQGKGIYPSDTQIAALSDGTTANPLLCDGSGAPGSGLDLRDDPNALYAKTAGTNVDGSGTYYFRIVPYNSAGALDVLSGSYFDVRLPGRSVASIDEQHVDADLGSWDGHSLGCRLDEGRLTSGVTDLAISSLGPAAELTRSYLSEAATTRYAPGWFFNFDQHLDLTDIGESPNKIVYVDEQGVEHDFLRSAPGGEWHEPNGLVATLTQNSDASWKLLFDQDQSHLTFSDAGVLLAETANGLTTDYEWSENELTITAANGQEIEVALSSGAVTGATYATASSGTRTVAYAGSGADWSVTYNGADTGANGTARTVAYSYANGRLTAVTQQAWPAGGSSATLAVIYDAGGRVTQVRYPDFDAQERPDARAEIDYHETEPQATVQRFGTVGATANQVISQSVYTWTPSSAQVPYLLDSVTDGFGDDETTTEYAYSDDLQLEEETVYDDEGDEISLYEADIDEDVLDGSHDVEAESIATEIDQQGEAQEAQTTTYDYDDEHQVVAESTTCDAAGKRTETRYTYDAVGNAIEEWQVYYDSAQTETPVVASYALRSYDGSGHMTMEKRLVSADYVEPGALEGEETPEDRTITNPVWAETTYSDFAPNGEPQTTVAKGVQLAPGGAAQDLTKTTTYDEFGNLLTQTDWGGRWSCPALTDTFLRLLEPC